MLRKVVRFRNFLRTWLPRRLSLVGADIQTRRVSQSPYTREPKKKFLIEDTRNLGFISREPPSCLPWSFSFLFFLRHLLVATDHLPWSSSFLSHIPFLWRKTSLAELDGFHVRDLVCSSSVEKNPLLSRLVGKKIFDGEFSYYLYD